MIILLIAGLIILCIGIILCIIKSAKLSRAEQFPAVIIGLRDKTVCAGGKISRVFCPIVKYTMYGKERTAEYYTYVKMKNYHRHDGDRVNVLINRSSPKVFYFADEQLPRSTEGIAFVASGLLLAALGAAVKFIG